MKLPSKIARLLLCTTSAVAFAVACGGDDENTDPGAGGAGNGPSRPQCFEPGGSQCTGSASGLVCPEGSTEAVEFTCATGEICDDGACRGQCESGETECVGSSVQRICTSDGRSWVNVACQEGAVCEDGSCGLEGGLVCVPGERRCDGEDTQQTCKEDGSGWDDVDCPGATACLEGACRGSVCEVGATKCDDALTNPLLALWEGTSPVAGVIYKCVDGERWVAEACPSGEELNQVCVYSGVNQAEVNKYRSEMFVWYMSMMSSSGGAALPSAPTIPATSKASCVEPECYPFNMFESPLGERWCGSSDEEEPYWESFSQCEGLIPYSNMTVKSYECAEGTACADGYGCVPAECVPGESRCSGESTYQYCSEGSSGYYFSGELSCFDGENSTACADVGEYPERTITCGDDPPAQPL